MTEKLIFYSLQENDLDEIVASFKAIGWNKPRSIYEHYLLEQLNGIRSIIVAKEDDRFCGYVTIQWKSNYANFDRRRIPEIADLNVLPTYRNKGIGTKLIQKCEVMVSKKELTQIGIGVGMTEDYGSAQRLYVQLGYVPDGQGLYYKYNPVSYGDNIVVDDDLILYFIKPLSGE
jgi:GNAT superfamily N-acetyltransferase